MSKILIATIINMCINSSTTKIQKDECVSFFGSCIENYSNHKEAMNECPKKWNKIKEEIK